MRRYRLFDICGIAAVIFFIAVVATDIDALRFAGAETTVAASPQELREGFREGVAWYGFYLREMKMGFSRVERRIADDGYSIKIHSLFRPKVFGRPTTVDLDLEATLDRQMALSTIELAVINGPTQFSASGEMVGDRLELVLRGAGMEHSTGYDLAHAPALDLSIRPTLIAGKPEVGTRTAYQTFDPMSLGLRTIELEYLGRDAIEVLGHTVDAHLIVQRSEGQMVQVWVNDLGEVLKEEMPLGIVAFRETEADATWGLGRGAIVETAEIGGLTRLLSLIGPAAGPSLSELESTPPPEEETP